MIRKLGDLYDGFLMIDRLYYRETGRHIPFNAAVRRCPIAHDPCGEPILFQAMRDKRNAAASGTPSGSS
jgi:hypothetical protein